MDINKYITVLGLLSDSKIAYLIYGAIIAAVASYIWHRKIQKEIWLRDFDRLECEQLVKIFEEIIITIEKGKEVEEDLIDKLTARTLLLRYLDIKTKRNIDHLKKLSFEHRRGVEKTKGNTSGTSQEEEHCKQEILNLISQIMDDLRYLFAK